MVSASSKRKVGTSLPTTRCTNCQTVFELPPELLESTDTRVRCGECLCIFDARDGLVGPSAESNQDNSGAGGVRRKQSSRPPKNNKNAVNTSETADEHSELDVTYSDFDLFSEEADLPALAYLDETRDTPEFDFDAVELGDEETFSDTLFSHDITIDADLPISESKVKDAALSSDARGHDQRAEVGFTKDAEPEEPLIFSYQDPPTPVDEEIQQDRSGGENESKAASEKVDTASGIESLDPGYREDLNTDEIDAPQISVSSELGLDDALKKRGNGWIWFGGFALLVGVFAATVIYPRWKSLDQSPTFRPVKLAVCQLLSCEVDTRVSIDELEVLKREVFESPSRDDALFISITIRNTAQFPQRYPVVEARMTNRVGRNIAQRAFRPTDYLPQWNRGDVLNAGETVDINLTVNDPGEAAEHHVLQLRELRLDCNATKAPDGSQRWPVDCAEL